MLARPNFFVLTGASGSGKSSIIDALVSLRHVGVEEVGRRVVRSQLQAGYDGTPWQDHRKFMQLLLAGYVQAFESVDERSQPVFFDRGIPECLGYASQLSLAEQEPFVSAATTHRYNPLVFFTPPWPEIYVTDAERRHTFGDGVKGHHSELASYRHAGYDLLEVPRGHVRARADFILLHVARLWSNRSIERTSSSTLRLPSATPPIER